MIKPVFVRFILLPRDREAGQCFVRLAVCECGDEMGSTEDAIGRDEVECFVVASPLQPMKTPGLESPWRGTIEIEPP